MTTTNPTSFAARHGWRLMLVASGVLLAAGGRMHPESDARDPLRQELATMTAADGWVPGHTLVVLSTILLAAGLWTALRGRAWPPPVTGALRLAAIAFSLYAVETVFHLAAAVDAHALAHGGAAPIAWTHIGLAVLLYPPAGLALAWLALTFGRAWRGPRRLIAVPGVVAGVLHAVSVPATVLFPDVEFTPVFAGAALLLALFSVATGLAGAPAAAPAPRTSRKAAVPV